MKLCRMHQQSNYRDGTEACAACEAYTTGYNEAGRHKATEYEARTKHLEALNAALLKAMADTHQRQPRPIIINTGKDELELTLSMLGIETHVIQVGSTKDSQEAGGQP